MRFRANIEHVQTFQRIIQAIEKLQKRCIVRFTETDMHIICNEETEDGVQVWSQIKADALFTDYRIQSNAGNAIALLLAPEALLAALRSAAGAPEVVLKLAKKHGHAVLAFEIALARGPSAFGGSGGGRRGALVAHDVLVDVLRPADIARLKEPLCPEPDIHILLPPLQKLRTVAEHLRTMADVLGVHASRRGALRLSVAADAVRVETQWTRCTIPNMATQEPSQAGEEEAREEPESEPEPGQMFGVHLSVRAFLKFLSSHVVSTTTIACICEDHCMILYVYIGDVADAGGVLTFYIPARLSGVD
ncbi:cell cycle checkpoint [Phellopilus nigrolimitatus]|nr:cell cycle checkpoint [Phellopilus nigrolimitatus]